MAAAAVLAALFFVSCAEDDRLTISNGVLTKCDTNAKGTIKIPKSVTIIGQEAFAGCIGITEVTIPKSVTSIKDNAFRECANLRSVTIGNGVTSIGGGAFMNCSSLATVEFKGTTAQWATITKGSWWSDDVPATTVKCSDGNVSLY